MRQVPPRNEEFQGYRNWNKEKKPAQLSHLAYLETFPQFRRKFQAVIVRARSALAETRR